MDTMTIQRAVIREYNPELTDAEIEQALAMLANYLEVYRPTRVFCD